MLAVLFSAPGFAMSADQSPCHPLVTSVLAQQPDQHHMPSADHCFSASQCMMCASITSATTVIPTQPIAHPRYAAVVNDWPSLSLLPELLPNSCPKPKNPLQN